jgi:hypothetical protein
MRLPPFAFPAQGDILEDIELIENLEETKRTAVEIEEKVAQAKVTEVSISAAREVYRPVAARGSQVYFLIDNLNALDRYAFGAVPCSLLLPVWCGRQCQLIAHASAAQHSVAHNVLRLPLATATSRGCAPAGLRVRQASWVPDCVAAVLSHTMLQGVSLLHGQLRHDPEEGYGRDARGQERGRGAGG